MKFKRVSACLLAAAMAATLLAGCGSSGSSDAASTAASEAETSAGGKETVTLWATGSDNVRAVYETLIEDFNTNSDYADQYQVELQFMLSGTGTQALTDMLVAAAKANQTGTDYDIVDLSGDDLSKIVSQMGTEYLVELDDSKIPNAAGVSAESSVAPEFVQPFRGTTVVLAYDSEAVETPPTTFEELEAWMKENPGRFAYNQPGTGGAGDSFARTTVYNQIADESAITSDDEAWTAEWDAGFAKLAELNEYMYESGGSHVYPAKNQGTLDLLNQGDIDMCPNWADMVLSQRAAGTLKDTIKITQIDPSFTGSFQTLAIPTFGSHEDGAYAFIDYMLSEAAQTILVHDMAAIPLIDTTNIDMEGYEDVASLDTSSFRIMSIGDLSTSFNERWDNEIATIG
ncbi:MAG: extracellular solute-binding protein [Lachnospiraceae bacterium]|nr:extracellular solute-binding protein [Lachnospiraceae bacterium]